jgi:N6-adenosine-specific RNA methylase IME4
MKKYNIVYADPPWQYQQTGVQGAAERHYPTMDIMDICHLPISEIAAKDSALFLWVTFPQMPEALRVIKKWGFTYKTVAFIWLKKNKKADSWFYGLGFWTRGNCEICLLATRGHPRRQSASVHQFIISPLEAHSKKPDITREKILTLMGDLPRVELFARQQTPGWDVWGDEIENNIDLTEFQTQKTIPNKEHDCER